MTSATRRCLCTLIKGSKRIDDGRGTRLEKISGNAGRWKSVVIGSTDMYVLGEVGSITAGSLLRRRSRER